MGGSLLRPAGCPLECRRGGTRVRPMQGHPARTFQPAWSPGLSSRGLSRREYCGRRDAFASLAICFPDPVLLEREGPSLLAPPLPRIGSRAHYPCGRSPAACLVPTRHGFRRSASRDDFGTHSSFLTPGSTCKCSMAACCAAPPQIHETEPRATVTALFVGWPAWLSARAPRRRFMPGSCRQGRAARSPSGKLWLPVPTPAVVEA